MPEMKNTKVVEAEMIADGQELSDIDLQNIVGGVIGGAEKMNWNGGMGKSLQIDFFSRASSSDWF